MNLPDGVEEWVATNPPVKKRKDEDEFEFHNALGKANITFVSAEELEKLNDKYDDLNVRISKRGDNVELELAQFRKELASMGVALAELRVDVALLKANAGRR